MSKPHNCLPVIYLPTLTSEIFPKLVEVVSDRFYLPLLNAEIPSRLAEVDRRLPLALLEADRLYLPTLIPETSLRLSEVNSDCAHLPLLKHRT